MKLAESEGIRLITIFEDEWVSRRPQVENFIKHTLGIFEKKIFARKCDIKQVSNKEARNFLDKNHIQGKSTGIHFGLYFNDELIAVISGGTHHRQNVTDSGIFVLIRLCFKSGYSIPGGASRLFKALVAYTTTKGYTKIVSWSDNRWSIGNVYEKIGFTLEEELGPDYSYTKKQ